MRRARGVCAERTRTLYARHKNFSFRLAERRYETLHFRSEIEKIFHAQIVKIRCAPRTHARFATSLEGSSESCDARPGPRVARPRFENESPRYKWTSTRAETVRNGSDTDTL